MEISKKTSLLGFLGISESFRMDSCTGSSSRESLVHENKKNKDNKNNTLCISFNTLPSIYIRPSFTRSCLGR